MLVAIDTATDYASLALYDGIQIRVEHTWKSPRRHTVELLPRLVRALEQVGTRAEDLAGVAVTLGPGSFTGLRIGMAVAKGLALARGIPLAGVPTLDVLVAAQGRDRRPLCAILQAGRGRVCVAIYRWRRGKWIAREEPHLTTWPILAGETSSPTLFCGEIDRAGAEALVGLSELAELTPPAGRLRRAGFLAQTAWRRIEQGDADDPTTLVPVYLKQPV